MVVVKGTGHTTILLIGFVVRIATSSLIQLAPIWMIVVITTNRRASIDRRQNLGCLERVLESLTKFLLRGVLKSLLGGSKPLGSLPKETAGDIQAGSIVVALIDRSLCNVMAWW